MVAIQPREQRLPRTPTETFREGRTGEREASPEEGPADGEDRGG
jgi:hypothetical protein